MATITLGLSGVTGGPNGNRTFTISDADVARWIAAYRPAAVRAANGASQTDAQVLAYWAKEVMRLTRQHVKDAETLTPTEIAVTEN